MGTSMKIPVKPGDPTGFDNYLGQEAIKRRLLLRMNAMRPGDSMKCLFFSQAGSGKTALARVVANELAQRGLAENYYEIVAGKFEAKDDVDKFLKQIPANSVIFIDEIHGLTGLARDALYPAIQDNIYSYNEEVGSVALPKGLHWFGATTDLGKVHSALQRRLMPIALEPLSLTDRFWLAMLQPRKVDDAAAVIMAERSFSPWELKDELYATAGDIATEQQSWTISLEHVLEACGILGIDQNSLRPKERLVLECLHNSPRKAKGEIVYSLAKNTLTIMAGLDAATYSNAVEPKLLGLGLVTVRAGVGRILTDKALALYFKESNEQKGASKDPNP